MEHPLPGPPLRIAVLGDFDGPHTRRWLRVFVERGHDVHAISYYRPRVEMPGVTVHVLTQHQVALVPPSPVGGRGAGGEGATNETTQKDASSHPHPFDHAQGRPSPLPPAGEGTRISAPSIPFIKRSGTALVSRVPADLLRLVHAMRYWRAGLRRVLDDIQPDVFHAHYVVEHGFYGALARVRPYVVSAWGSDLLVESRKTIGRRIASYVLSKADLVTVQDPSMALRAVELGAPAEDVHVVRLGIDSLFFDNLDRSVNVREDDGPPIVISDRALEPLYNVDLILRAFARVRERLPDARLIVAHDGSEGARLMTLAGELGLLETSKAGEPRPEDEAIPRVGEAIPRVETRGMAGATRPPAVRFAGRLTPDQLHEALLEAHVYVSVPRSDAFSLSTMEAMASGAFPIVSDLSSADGMIKHGDNGLRVPAGNIEALTEALHRALTDSSLRHGAVGPNRALVESEGRLEANMLAMERHYYRLAGHPIGSSEAI